MWMEKSNVLDCSRHIPQNQSLTKTIKSKEFLNKPFLLLWRCMVKAFICQTPFQTSFLPTGKVWLFAGYQSDELLLHYSTTTDLSIAPCSLLSILKSHPPLQSTQTLNPMTKLCYKLISKRHLKHIPCCILCNIHHNQLNTAASSHTHTSAADRKYLEQIHSLPLVTLFTEMRV